MIRLPIVHPKYFYSLDVVRGFAALAVVLWHWQHLFYHLSVLPPTFNRPQQPLYSIFYLFYNNGLIAVDFFFCLSGFIFFYLYKQNITNKKIGFKDFTILRFSRLYPLHFVTLITVAILQAIVYANYHGYFVIEQNGLPHFILNLLFIQTWGFELFGSFNGPSWSVSIEVLLYGIFFIFCWLGLSKRKIYLIMLLGLAIQVVFNPIGRGIYLFFGGGALYYLYVLILNTDKSHFIRKLITIIFIIYWVLCFTESKTSFFETHFISFWNSHLSTHVHKKAIDIFVTLCLYSTRLVLFPLSILCLALNEDKLKYITDKFHFIGKISYSSYLIHFPLQLVFYLTILKLGIGQSFFYTPLSLFIFFAILIPLSLLSYTYFENPLQKKIRGLINKDKK